MGHFKDQLTDIFLEQVGTASILHDIGKVATPDRILLKPGRLDSDERVIMEQHAPNGARILQKARDMVDGSSYLTLGHEIAARHHEAFDGTGYPDGMAGTSIPLSARITAVADVYDALTHRRPYKEPWSREDALAYINARRGTQFDPEIVDAFMRVEARGLVNRVP
jgi:response regulator RpfG family c-di-GMP phosphodiesterase